jgi:hypothetical protein
MAVKSKSTKRRAHVRNLPKRTRKLTAAEAKKIKGGDLKNVQVTSLSDSTKLGRKTKLMEEEGIYY